MKNKDIICISVSDWIRPWGSKQRLMTRLAEHNRVLYVEYQSSFLDFIRHPKYFFNRLKNINKLRKMGDNIHIYTPLLLLPFAYYFTFINRINQAILRFSLRRIIKELEFKNPILWVYSVSSSGLVGKLGEDVVIYHCAADFTGEKKNRLRKSTVKRLEDYLVKQAQIVLTLTKDLCSRFRQSNQNTFYFPSAVDFDQFETVRINDSGEPGDLSAIKKPRLGIIGYLDGNILDVDLLDYLARANPEWSLVMIGPVFRKTRSLDRLKENENIHFLGEKPSALIPLYLKYLDVCLVPYVRGEFTNNVSPLKLYEYLAMGKPVVSTFFSDELEAYKDIIAIAKDREQFLQLIRTSLSNSRDEKEIASRIKFAAENSWQNRLDFLSEKLEGLK